MSLARAALLLFLFAPALFAQDSSKTTATKDETPDISDNSFLIEEAYNQEKGVVQHINFFSRLWNSKEFVYTFTQEWPVNPAPKNQLSYTIPVLHTGRVGTSFGDVALNYRYQLYQSERVAFAPRVSLLLPAGDYKRGFGSGTTGVQFNLPLSVELNDKWVTHWNLGGTILPDAKNAAGQKASTYGYNFGASVIFKPVGRFNLMLEAVSNSGEDVVATNITQRTHDAFINPAVRWAYNLKSGMQIVPGVGVPIGVGPSSGEKGVIFYLSFEHPFGKRN